MVYLAFLNVALILFDMTYLWLRPVYFDLALPVVRTYDEWVKGIEPHPETARYLETVNALEAAIREGGDVASRLAEVEDRTAELFAENPFDRSGQGRNLARIEARTRRFLTEALGQAIPPGAGAGELIVRLFDVPAAPVSEEELGARLDFFDEELLPLLALNYHRDYDLDGTFVDRFWLFDLPFLLIFAVEFLVRWALAIRRRRYPKWFLFPIFNWYDVLGLVPVKELRFFRLFRIASIYVRLYKSDHSAIGEDIVSRTARYFANIINEEISDMVSLRILNETQEELRDGTHQRIIREVAAPHREVLAEEIVTRIHRTLASAEVTERLRAYLDQNLESSVESAKVLRRIPLPGSVVRPLLEVIAHVIFDALIDTLNATLETEHGRDALKEITLSSIDGLVEDLTTGETERLVREISIEAIEHVKEAVRVRKWVEAEKPDRMKGGLGEE